ncbi:MAG: glutathione S-transferase family protein [Myxococcota bacterium]
MKLYTTLRSPYARKVRIVLAEKGIAYEPVVVDLAARTDAFWAMAPIGKIPVLEVDGLVIPDSTTICEYLEDHHPTPPLYERDRTRCRILEELGDAVSDCAVGAFHARSDGHDAEVATLLASAARILRHLAIRRDADDWPPGFTVGDASVLSALGYLSFRHGEGWREAHPTLARWFDGLAGRPSVAATVPTS